MFAPFKISLAGIGFILPRLTIDISDGEMKQGARTATRTKKREAYFICAEIICLDVMYCGHILVVAGIR